MKSIRLFEEIRIDSITERFYAINKLSARMCIAMNRERNLRFDVRYALNIEGNNCVKEYAVNTFLYRYFDEDMNLIR